MSLGLALKRRARCIRTAWLSSHKLGRVRMALGALAVLSHRGRQAEVVLVADALTERGDVLAYLDRKIANAGRVIATHNDRDGHVAAMRRAWEIMRDDVAAGLHQGSAAVGDAIAAGDA